MTKQAENIRLNFSSRLKSFLIMITFVCFAPARNLAQIQHPYCSVKPITEATVFADGIISTGSFDSHPAFRPDGKTLYFLRSTPSFNLWTILFSRFDGRRWSTPEVAPFSGQYSDADPFITFDGSRLYFISNRPVPGKTRSDLDIWMVEKTDTGWSNPKNLGGPINGAGNEWYPTIVATALPISVLIVKAGREEPIYLQMPTRRRKVH